MRALVALSIAAYIGLLSTGALGRPIPPRGIYPHLVYRSDNLAALDLRAPNRHTSESRAHLELSLAAFSKAIEVGFTNVVIRPHEHLVSLFRYYKSPESLSSLASYSVDAAHRSEWSINNLKKRYPLGLEESEEDATRNASSSPAHDRRESRSNDQAAASARPPDYRRSMRIERSSTHAVAGEHLKARANTMD